MKPARKPRSAYPFVVPRHFVVPPDISAVYVAMVGGGGGGGGGAMNYGGGGVGGMSMLNVKPGSVMQVTIPAPVAPDEMRCYLALLDVRNSRVWRQLPIEIRTNITRTLKGE